MVTKTKPKKPNSRAMAKEKRREQILDAARDVFAKKGFHQASVKDIVSICGVAQGTFYLYFESKRDVFGALLDDFTESILKAFFIPGAGEVTTQEDVYRRFSLVSHSATRMFLDNMDMARIFMLEAQAKEPGFEKKVSAFYNVLVQGTADNLKLWMERGLLREADPMVIAHCVVGMVERLILQWMSKALPVDIEEMVDEAVKFELYGILKDPASVFEK